MPEGKSFWVHATKAHAIALILGACICAFTGCTNPNESSDGYYSDSNAPERTIPVTITSGYFNTSARSILPDNWNETEKANLTYTLEGNSTTGSSYSKTYNYSDIKNGIKIYIESGDWTFTLTGKTGDEIVLSGTKDVSITSPATIPISLSPYATSNVTGNLSINSLVFTNNINVAENEIKVFILKDYADALTSAIETATDVTLTGVDGGRVALKATVNDLDNGEYVVAIQFGSNPTIYKENLIIDPFKTSTLNKELSTDFFLTKPVAPTNLKVSYDKESLSTSSAASEYKATFTWNCDATNELGYTIVITDSDGNLSYYTENPNITLQESIVSGSIADNAGEGEAVIELKTGLNYSAYIVAWNSVGDSEKCYLDDSIDSKINLTAVTYHLNKGSLILKSGKASIKEDATTKTYIDYFTRKETSSYTFPTGGTTAPRVYKSEKDENPAGLDEEMQFAGWYITSTFNDDAYAIDTNPIDVNLTSSGNIELFACWKSLRTLSPITFPKYVDPFTNPITLKINKSEVATKVIDMSEYLDSEYDTFVWRLGEAKISNDKELTLSTVSQITGTGTYNLYFETKKSTVTRSTRSTTITLVVKN